MPWFKVDDDFHDHPKVRSINPAAVGLWTLCGSWSADNLTDGFVPIQVVREKGGKNWGRCADELVRAGLWTVVEAGQSAHVSNTRVEREKRSRRDMPDGYLFHDWTKYQPTRGETLAEREASAARQRARRARSKKARHGVTNGHAPDPTVAPERGAREGVSRDPDPYGSTTRIGAVRDVGTRASETTKTIDGIDPKPTTPGWRSPDVERALANVRATLPKGRSLRGHAQPEKGTP